MFAVAIWIFVMGYTLLYMGQCKWNGGDISFGDALHCKECDMSKASQDPKAGPGGPSHTPLNPQPTGPINIGSTSSNAPPQQPSPVPPGGTGPVKTFGSISGAPSIAFPLGTEVL